MKNSILILVFGLWLLGKQNGLGQGFVNLNFEQARISGYSTSGSEIPDTNAVPGWTIFSRGIPNPNSLVLYHLLPLSGGVVNLADTNPIPNVSGSSMPPMQGKYYVWLMPFNYPGFEYSVGIGQTGQVPAAALTLTFWASGVLDVTFNGQNLPTTVIGNGATYDIRRADISSFAGQMGLLLFTAPIFSGMPALDNIQFSTTAVPEPATWVLILLGFLCVIWRLGNRQTC